MAGEGSRQFIRSKGFRWSLIGIGAFLVVFALVGFFLVPVLAKNKIEELLGAELQRKVTVERIEVNPFLPNARLIGLSVANLAGAQPMLGFGRLEVDLSWRSVIQLAPVIRGVRLIDPVVQLARDAQGRLSIQDLLDKWAAKPKSNDPTPKFSVANIELLNGRVAFDDQQARVQHKLEAIEIKLPFLSSLPVYQDVNVHPRLSALVNGTKFTAEGQSKPFSGTHESTLQIDLASFDLRPYLGYVPGGLPVTVSSANLAIKAQVEFAQPAQGRPTVNIVGQARLSEVDLREKGGEPLVKLAALTADAKSLAPLEGRYTLSRIAIEAPQVTVHRRTGQTAFLEAVLPAAGAAKEPNRQANKDTNKDANRDANREGSASKAAEPLVWLIEEFVLKDGQLDFADALFQPKALAVKTDALQVAAKGLTNRPDGAATYELAVHSATGEQITTQGEIRLAPVAAKGKFDVRNIGLKTWWWVAEPHVALDATDGELALAGQFDLALPDAGPSIRLEALAAQLRNLVLRQRWDKVEFAKVPTLDIAGTSVDLGARKVVIGSVESSAGRIGVVRDREGGLNVTKLVAPASASAKPAATVVKGPPAPAPKEPSTPAASAAPAWTVALNKLLLDRYMVELKDLQAGKTADLKLDGMRVLVENVSTEKSTGASPKGRLEFNTRFNQQGSLQASGPLSIAPVATTLKIDAKSLGIVPLQPYFTEYVNAVVASGAITAKGEVGVRVPEQGPVQATYKGDVVLADFAAVTKAANEDLLKWKSLAVGGIDLVAQPFKLDVGSVALTDFFSRLIISPEGRFNLQDVLVRNEAPAAPAQGAAVANTSARAPASTTTAPVAAAPANNTFGSPDLQTSAPAPTRAATTIVPGQDSPSGPPDMRVGRISLVNGNIDFSDFFIKPNYRANLTGMTGGISQLSAAAPGDLELRGKVDNAGSVEILGKVNPLARSLFLDLQANATDIDLPRLSPYSVKYVGYGIEKGKLSMKVKYAIDDRKLTAENNIVLDQLTFGEKIEGPDAIKLPVLFAVALLKDRNGVIDVNLPISGSLDDPQFSVAGIVIRIIVNLIVKAVTAPFSLLAGLAGGGPELSWLEFAPGRVALEPDTDKKLQSLAKALTDRPGLKLDLAGRVDREADRQALVKRALEQQVKAAKVKETVKTGATASAIDDVVIAPQEYEKFLKIAFAASPVPKPKLASGATKELKVEEIEQLMMAQAQVGDSELRQLANDRAQRAKDWLVEKGGIAGERMFVVAPKLDADGIKAGEKASRVDLSLK